MRKWYVSAGIFILFFLFSCQQTKQKVKKRHDFALVIHGGAGVIEKGSLTPGQESAYHESLRKALEIGETILNNGGISLDAVEEVITFLENDSLFNAGKGAVFTHDGKNELDASIMEGAEMKAGAVAGVSTVKNPIKAARAVMEKSNHVLLAGKGAEEFCKMNDIELVDPSYFYTRSRFESLQKILQGHSGAAPLSEENMKVSKRGTVGCVALDKHGNIAAGTSTGGMTNKRFNRVGDSPIIGAGTYADNETCGISCTGHGEFFIRFSVAKDVAALMEYKGMTLPEASNEVIHKKLIKKGGEGGLVGIDRHGNIVMPFNTPGMYRGYCLPGKKETFIYK